MIIEAHDVEFSYNKIPVLEDVNLEIPERQFVGVFGPNGGGKTTFLQLLMGFLKPTKGSLSIFQKSPKDARDQIGYVPQIANYDRQFPISVLELVLMGCLSETTWYGSVTKQAKEKARKALQIVNLLDKQDVAFGTLSGGQAQRALIARALVSEPKLLLLDEPTASVDPAAEQDIYNLLASLKNTMTILMVTHDLQTIHQNVDRWLCINRQITSFDQDEVCQHFSLGLYHPPLS